MPAELQPIERLQEYISLGAAVTRYHRLATRQHRFQPSRPGDVVRVHVRVHCNNEKRAAVVKTPVIVIGNERIIIDKRYRVRARSRSRRVMLAIRGVPVPSFLVL